jgi:hypothetical protein
MRDFDDKSIKLFHVDPTNPTRRTQVMISIAHIVRLVPRHYIESGGKQMITAVEEGVAPERGMKRSFMVFDSLGGQFDSYGASERVNAVLEQIWNESA